MKSKTPKKTNQKRATVSRQRLYQLRKRAEGLCWRCGKPAVGSMCLKHLEAERERQRRIRGWTKKRDGALSRIIK